MKEEEIIFQVKINRKEETFELVKTKLGLFEMDSFIRFLEDYVESCKKISQRSFEETYFEDKNNE